MVQGIGGKLIDRKEFMSFATYCWYWKKNYPQLKVSRAVEDICQYCFVFANCHCYLANHSAMSLCTAVLANDETTEAVCDAGDGTIASSSDPMNPEVAASAVAEEREVLLLECATHIQMAHVQRSLYQAKVDEAVSDAKARVEHEKRRYKFVVDYGQNMELPIFNFQQPGCTYYYSPLSVYNLGMVNHAHKYADGSIKEHIFRSRQKLQCRVSIETVLFVR